MEDEKKQETKITKEQKQQPSNQYPNTIKTEEKKQSDSNITIKCKNCGILNNINSIKCKSCNFNLNYNNNNNNNNKQNMVCYIILLHFFLIFCCWCYYNCVLYIVYFC